MLGSTVAALLVPPRRAAWRDEMARHVRLGVKLAGMLATMALGAALYGAVLGLWRGGAQVAWVALKLPLVLVLTTAITLLFNTLTGRLFGLRLGILQVAVLTLSVLATAALVLLSLVPVAWLFTVSAPLPSPTARTTHNLLYLFHTSAVAFGGLAGGATLWRGLRDLAPDTWAALRVFLLWLLTFALVGGEVAWALRPFVGSIYEPVTFLRSDALEGNVYEFILREIVPHLLGLGDG